MDYSNYKKSRDLAWEFLIQHHVSTLPIPVAHLAKEAGIHCMPYELGQPLLEDLGLWEHCCTQSDGFAIHVGQNGVLALVLYNDKQTRQRCRFTIAHEMGHIFCRNLSNKYPPERKEVYSLINREPCEEDEEEEREANVFASRLLAPALRSPRPACADCGANCKAVRY